MISIVINSEKKLSQNNISRKDINIIDENSERVIIREPSDINHLKNSFRIKCEEKIRAVDGENFEYMLEVLEINKREIICKILSKHEDVYSSKTIIHAAIGMLKNDNMNLV
ncbi:MAG: RNA methyltransferase PUA domain-containing protein, partial [Fusobacteriaceae bacterium]